MVKKPDQIVGTPLTEGDMVAKRKAKAAKRADAKAQRENRIAENKNQKRLKGEASGKIVAEDKDAQRQKLTERSEAALDAT